MLKQSNAENNHRALQGGQITDDLLKSLCSLNCEFNIKNLHISPSSLHAKTPNSELNVGSLTLRESSCLSEISAGWWFISLLERVCMSRNLCCYGVWVVSYLFSLCVLISAKLLLRLLLYIWHIHQPGSGTVQCAGVHWGWGLWGTHTNTRTRMNKPKMKQDTHSHTQRSHARGIAFSTGNMMTFSMT